MDAQELQRLKNRYDIIGNDAALNRALETIVAVAPTELTVLIQGESGVGKDVLPQIIHQMSRRRNGKYLAINCGAIPAGTINAELFGHEKGSFTGAVADRKGYFEEADGGTLFLDEIGELPRDTQAMLLRVLQSGEFIKVGSSKVQKTDVRVIAATNINLPYAVAQGKFREDLFYRLNAITVQMPSLRDRKDDIYLLFRKFTSDFCDKYSRTKVSLNHEAITLLRSYRWPGNIRQLKNVSETIAALLSRDLTPGAERTELDAAAISPFIPNEQDTLIPATVDGPRGGGPQSFSDSDKQVIIKAIMDLKQEVDSLRRMVLNQDGGAPRGTANPAIGAPKVHPVPVAGTPASEESREEPEWQEAADAEPLSIRKANMELIQHALEKHHGNVKEAATELGISERTIYRKLAKMKNG